MSDKTNDQELQARLRATAVDESSNGLEEAIKGAGDRRSPVLADDVLSLLERTSVRDLRNACAYYLHEVPVPGQVGRLVRVAERDDVRPDRGTIMYALAQHDCSEHVPFLVKVLVSDGYEAAQHACDAIEALPASVPRDGLEMALAALRATTAKDPWRAELVEIAIEELAGKKRR